MYNTKQPEIRSCHLSTNTDFVLSSFVGRINLIGKRVECKVIHPTDDKPSKH